MKRRLIILLASVNYKRRHSAAIYRRELTFNINNKGEHEHKLVRIDSKDQFFWEEGKVSRRIPKINNAAT